MQPDISDTAFWDVNFSEIDYVKDMPFVIGKVFNYGLWNDQVEIIRFYGKDKIRNQLKNIAYFRKDILPFIIAYFNVGINDLTCYTKRQSTQVHWNY